MRRAVWLACCGVAGAVAALFAAIVLFLAAFGIDPSGKTADRVGRVAFIAALAVGLLAGVLLGGRQLRASGGRPGIGAWIVVIVAIGIPATLFVIAAHS